MKESRIITQGSEKDVSGYYPHRWNKKQLPKISEKAIPTRFVEFRRCYQGELDEFVSLDRWAYVPTKAHKKSGNQRSETDISQSKVRTSSSEAARRFRSTSEVFLKKYLKRKQTKQNKDGGNITNYVGLKEKGKQNSQDNFLEGLIKYNSVKLAKFKNELMSTIEKRYTAQKIEPQNYKKQQEIEQFKSQKMCLKEKLKFYESNIKTKRFQVKFGDRRYKNIRQTRLDSNK